MSSWHTTTAKDLLYYDGEMAQEIARWTNLESIEFVPLGNLLRSAASGDIRILAHNTRKKFAPKPATLPSTYCPDFPEIAPRSSIPETPPPKVHIFNDFERNLSKILTD
jgi:hypothetical protein